MDLQKRRWITTLITAMMLGVSLLPRSAAYACSPAPNGFVFADTIAVDDATLPPGVVFQQESLYEITFANSGDETVYVLADPQLLRDSWPVVDAPLELEQLMPEDQVVALEIASSETYDLRRSDAFFPGFDPDAYFDLNTPEEFEGLPVPDPIESQIAMIAGGEVYEVDVAINYEPNPEYDPEGYDKGVEACAQINETSERTTQAAGVAMALPVIAISVCGILVALAGGAGLIFFLMRRRT